MLDTAAALGLGQAALLVYIAAVDITTRRIHAGALLALAGITLLGSLALEAPALPSAIVGAACGGGVFWLAHLGGRIYGKRAYLPEDVVVFGIGDVHLMAAVGLAVGFPKILLALLLTVVLGGLGAFCVALEGAVTGRGSMRFFAMPYAPFVSVSAIALILSPLDLLLTLAG